MNHYFSLEFDDSFLKRVRIALIVGTYFIPVKSLAEIYSDCMDLQPFSLPCLCFKHGIKNKVNRSFVVSRTLSCLFWSIMLFILDGFTIICGEMGHFSEAGYTCTFCAGNPQNKSFFVQKNLTTAVSVLTVAVFSF